MKQQDISRILADTAYVRTGGSPGEHRCAQYLQGKCAELGAAAALEPFSVDMAAIRRARLCADNREIPCKAYFCCGNADIQAPLYYLKSIDPYSLRQCRGKVALIDGRMDYWTYQDLLASGAAGFITFTGDILHADRDILQRTLRSEVTKGGKLPGVSIHAEDALALVKGGAQRVRLAVEQEEYTGQSHNVVLDLPGEYDEYIVLSAHYDSVPLSTGAYDNMSGCVGLLAMAEHFARRSHRYGLRFVWCGSEELGLLGSAAYCRAHAEELGSFVLDVNLDMIGSAMGPFFACCTAEERLAHYLEYFSAELGFGLSVRSDVCPSDSTPFADSGVPSVSFTRDAPKGVGSIHSRYDTDAILSAGQMAEDIAFVTAFVERMANARHCPVAREIPARLKEKIDVYMDRKRTVTEHKTGK